MALEFKKRFHDLIMMFHSYSFHPTCAGPASATSSASAGLCFKPGFCKLWHVEIRRVALPFAFSPYLCGQALQGHVPTVSQVRVSSHEMIPARDVKVQMKLNEMMKQQPGAFSQLQ